MADVKKDKSHYISAKQIKEIAKQNSKIIRELEKKKRRS